ncbi:MAG: hypothetical protein K2P41_07655, partial [Lachnospiraceae bacterium]|nr:hypothetical protein [Lachnospiraceae bacterium]
PPRPAEKLQNFFGVFLQFQIGVDSREIPRSGTEATINYARKMCKEIIIIDLSARKLTHENSVADFTAI